MKDAPILYPSAWLDRKAKSLPQNKIAVGETAKNISKMFRIMYYRGGVGLASTQVGWNSRVFVVNPEGTRSRHSEAIVFINPEIMTDGDNVIVEEGCLSFPGIFLPIKRCKNTYIRAHDINGNVFEREYDDFTSIIIQHEHDHIDGITFLDRAHKHDIKRRFPKLLDQMRFIERARLKRKAEERRRKKRKKK